jgi:competence protein ComEC
MQADIPTPGQGISVSGDPVSIGLGAMPLFHAAWLFALGITLTQWLWLRPGEALIALVIVAALCGCAALRAQRVAALPLAILWLLLGAWCAEMEPHPAAAAALLQLSDGLLRTVEGTVSDAGPVRNETEQSLDTAEAAVSERPSQRIDLRVSSLEVVTDAEDVQKNISGGVRLTVRWPANASGLQPFHCGDHIRAIVRLLPPETYRDPGVWSRADFLLDAGITSTATVNIERVERVGAAQASASLTCRIRGLQEASSARLLALPSAMRSLPATLRLTADDAVLLSAMVTGDRTYLTHSLRVGFERTGSFHMLVVSGFHLAIVAACVLWIARRLRLPRVPATLLTILVSFAYALFTGFNTPVQRSLWMVTLYLLGRLVYRDRSPMNIIGFAALCLLTASPRSLFDSSFQMTLLAVVSIGGIATPLLQSTIHPYVAATRDLKLVALDIKLLPRLAEFRVILRMAAETLQALISPGRKAAASISVEENGHPQLTLFHDSRRMTFAAYQAARQGRFGESVAWTFFPWTVRFVLRLVELLIVSTVVELVMTLPMALYFHRITVFALPVNILVLPLLAFLMPAALLTLIALSVWPQFAVLPAAAAALLLHLGEGLVRFFGSLALGDFRIATPLVWQSAAFVALLAAAVLLAHRATLSGLRRTRRLVWLALITAALVAIAPRPIDHPRGALLMEAIDVGQGDSLLLITPDGKTLLVDGGGFGGGPRQAPQEFDIGEEVVSQTLWARGIQHLDVVALTHAHSDHMGGLPAVLRNFHPDELWVGNNPRFGAYNALLNEAAALHVRVRSLHAGDTPTLGSAQGQVQINVLAPFPNYQPGPEPTNNDSLVMHVAYGATSVMLEGDAEAPIEESMLAEPGLQSTLLKVGHHGSITSTRPEFLERVNPQWAIISCGLHNRYGHPRTEVLEELQAAHVHTFSTDINGISCFRLDGKVAEPDLTCSVPR